MRRFLLSLLALLGVGCALVVTASSTMRQAYGAGMPEPVPLALVGLLEVVNVAGTVAWLSDARAQHRVEAAGGVALASLVTAVCGALTYGPLGLVAPVGLLAAVHLVSRLWAPVPPPGTGVVDDAAPVVDQLGAGVPSRQEEPRVRAPSPPTVDEDDHPDVAPDRSAGPDWSDDVAVLADLRERGETDPTARSLRSRYGMRHERAVRLVGEHTGQADRSAPVRAGTGVAP